MFTGLEGKAAGAWAWPRAGTRATVAVSRVAAMRCRLDMVREAGTVKQAALQGAACCGTEESKKWQAGRPRKVEAPQARTRSMRVSGKDSPSLTAGCSTRSEERRVGKECRSRWSPY